MTALNEPAAEAVNEAADEARAGVICSFCLKPAAEVATMVGGLGVFICDTCVSACVEIIEKKQEVKSNLADWERDLADEDLLGFLPKAAAAGAQVERQLVLWVSRARARGITWARIGAALGMTRQSAWERFSGEE